MPVKNPKLGQAVEYVSTKGQSKMALVIGTPDTIAEGTSVPALAEGQLHLQVFSPNGNIGPRFSVPSEALVADNPEFQSEDGPRGVWRLVK